MDFADFQPALFAAATMNAFDGPWCIAGGWAIDLWLGRLSRGHASVAVAVFREDQVAVRDFLGAGWRFAVPAATAGAPAQPWRYDRQLLMLPVRRILASAPPTRMGAPRRVVELLLHERDSVDWFDPHDPGIRWPVEQWSARAAFGVPALAPHLALLAGARRHHPQDDLDLRSALPHLPPELRRWLADALSRVGPNHPWRATLTSGG